MLSESESLEVLASNEAKELILMQNQFIDRVKGAISRGYSIEYLSKISANAINKNEHSEILRIIFGSVKNGNIFIQNIQRARLNFLTKNKFLLENKDEIVCTSCNKVTPESASLFFKNLNTFDKSRLKVQTKSGNVKKLSMYLESVGNESETPVCGAYWQQVKLLACMALCSASTGGAGTLLCGWACWCMLCPKSVTGEILC